MKWTERNIGILFVLCCFTFAGCGGNAEGPQVNPPGWEPTSVESSSPSPLDPYEKAGELETPQSLFNADDFARELSVLFTRAAGEVAKLDAETRIDSEFASDAAKMLDESAVTLKDLADMGYESIETELLDAYREYARKTGAMEDMLNLGEGMLQLLDDTEIGDPIYTLELLDMKEEYWRERMDKISGELAAERSKFIFAKDAMLIARESSIVANQQVVVNLLEEELSALADDYAMRVRNAIDTAAGNAGLNAALGHFTAGDISGQVAEFETDLEMKHKKIEIITGS